MPFLDQATAAEYGLSGSASLDAELAQIGFGQAGIKNPQQLPNLSPNYPYTYTGSCTFLAAANSTGNIAIRTETGGVAFMCGQHFGFALDSSGNVLDPNRIFITITTVQRNWMNQEAPLSMLVASTSNPNGPRFMREFVKPGDVVNIAMRNATGTAGTLYYALAGSRYNN